MKVQSVEGAAPAAGRTTDAAPAAGEVGEGFKNLVHDLERGERFMNRVERQAARGRDFSPSELIAIQAGVYRYSHQLETFSKLVDRTTSAIRRTLESTG
jgi:hypothetical protein